MKKIFALLSVLIVFFVSSSVVFAAVDNTKVTKVEIKTSPKVKYTIGEKLDLSSLVVNLTKSDPVTVVSVPFANFVENGITTSKANGVVLAEADTKVVVTVNGKTLDILITVSKAATVKGITIKTNPTKTSYNIGEKLDLTGLVVTLTKTDDTKEDVSFIAEIVKADGTKAVNPFRTYGILTSKLNGTTLTDKDLKISVGYGRYITTSFDIVVSVNLSCIKAKVTGRETSVMAAYEKFNATMKASLTKRTAAVNSAWAIPVTINRNKAIKAAWDAFKLEQKDAKSAKAAEIKTIWNTWKNDLKSCGIYSTGETQSLDLL